MASVYDDPDFRKAKTFYKGSLEGAIDAVAAYLRDDSIGSSADKKIQAEADRKISNIHTLPISKTNNTMKKRVTAARQCSLSELASLKTDFEVTKEMIDQSFSQLDQVLHEKGFSEEVLSSKKHFENKDLLT